jgi:hypothetical protein
MSEATGEAADLEAAVALARELRQAAEVVVFLDDWNSHGTDECSFTARSFRISNEPRTVDLIRCLRDAGAEKWHASGPRNEVECLFTSERFASVLRAARRCDTRLFSILIPLQLVRDELPRRDALLRQMPAELERRWNPGGEGSVYAAALHHTILALHAHLVAMYPAQRQFVLFTDSWSWLRASGDALIDLGTFENMGVSLTVWAVSNKETARARNLLPFLGMVDSEAWFLGRYFRHLKFNDGSTIVDRLKRPRGSAGSASEQAERLFTDEELNDLLRPHIQGRHARFLRYMSLWALWYRHRRAVNLSQTPTRAEEVARALRDEVSEMFSKAKETTTMLVTEGL